MELRDRKDFNVLGPIVEFDAILVDDADLVDAIDPTIGLNEGVSIDVMFYGAITGSRQVSSYKVIAFEPGDTTIAYHRVPADGQPELNRIDDIGDLLRDDERFFTDKHEAELQAYAPTLSERLPFAGLI